MFWVEARRGVVVSEGCEANRGGATGWGGSVRQCVKLCEGAAMEGERGEQGGCARRGFVCWLVPSPR